MAVAIVEVMVVVIVVVKVLVWAAAVTALEVLVIGVLVDVKIIGRTGVIVIVLKFVLPVSYSVNVTPDVVFGSFANRFADFMIGVLLGIIIEVLTDANTNAFTVVTALEFPVWTPLEEISR